MHNQVVESMKEDQYIDRFAIVPAGVVPQEALPLPAYREPAGDDDDDEAANAISTKAVVFPATRSDPIGLPIHADRSETCSATSRKSPQREHRLEPGNRSLIRRCKRATVSTIRSFCRSNFSSRCIKTRPPCIPRLHHASHRWMH